MSKYVIENNNVFQVADKKSKSSNKRYYIGRNSGHVRFGVPDSEEGGLRFSATNIGTIGDLKYDAKTKKVTARVEKEK